MRSVRIRPRLEQTPAEESRQTKSEIAASWFKDETFYRDITTRSVSIVLTASIGYLAAIALGYVGKPSGQAAYSFVWAVATGIVMAALGYAIVNGRDGLTFVIVSLGGVACLVGTWYGPVWFGDFAWKDKWNWIAMALQITLVLIAVAFVRRRTRPRPD